MQLNVLNDRVPLDLGGLSWVYYDDIFKNMSIDLTDDTSYVSYGDATYLTKYFCSKSFPDDRLKT